MHYISLDSHKRYSWVRGETVGGEEVREGRVGHARGGITAFLRGFAPGSPVAVETTGNWYWIVDEIEAAGMKPRLVHARKAKLMMGMINKTDKLDVAGMNQLQRSGTLPEVWIPSGRLRDHRELPRTRMVLVAQKTRLKNRIHATLAKYGVVIDEVTDIFGQEGKKQVRGHLKELPEQTGYVVEVLLKRVEATEREIKELEGRIRTLFEETPERKWLDSVPGVGEILSVVMALEIGDVGRFSSPERLASYAGTTPRVHASGGRVRYGQLRPDVNRYLKWAFIEAANVVCLQRRHHGERKVTRLYNRLRGRIGHAKAVGAVARHLAESAYWVLTKRQEYCEPKERAVSTTKK